LPALSLASRCLSLEIFIDDFGAAVGDMRTS
jgi:hypothetical protein